MLVDKEVRPAGIAVDGENVYWTDLDQDSVRKVAKSGGEPVTLWFGTGLQAGIAIDDTSVYVIRESPNEILRIPKVDGAPEKISEGPQESTDIAVSSGDVFWLGRQSVGHFRKGAASILLADDRCEWGVGDLGGLAIDDRSVYTVTCVPMKPKNLHEIFLTIGLFGPISAIARDGSGLRTLAAGHFRAPLAADEAHVYFTDGLGELLRVAKTGGEPKKVETGSHMPLTDIAADESGVYVLAGSSPSKLDGMMIKLARIP